MQYSINHYVSLIYQVLEDTPGYYISQAFPHYARGDSSEVPNKPVMLINLEDSLGYALVMLCLVFVVPLEEHSRADDVKWVSDQTAAEVCCD